jgi:glycosyltransferase involved in cell wall biosynthesis
VAAGTCYGVSVLTPTVAGREKLLRECEWSVVAQTVTVFEHLVERDEQRDGCSATMNRVAARARGEWLLPLADDDLLLPGCVEHLTAAAAADADVIYSPPLVSGNEDRWWFFQAPPVIPATALIRAELWRELGGYDDVAREEDRKFWIKALEAGARFVRVDEPCWVYRQWDGNKSIGRVA